ncbi:OLC1v1032366C1 [Oldenlandia corymbosa var. corymbosa]|uniref:GDT1 family protein n=1 Tax=Oldenlandia corymbosa var. corymbosa TaxID=529605 RepID=A0AAV1CP17_OLDCO|nr:OLC1v1032366C1 [Oldenlandia corymbosa var. corymbosa]
MHADYLQCASVNFIIDSSSIPRLKLNKLLQLNLKSTRQGHGHVYFKQLLQNPCKKDEYFSSLELTFLYRPEFEGTAEKMSLSLMQGFTKSLALTVLSEVGDNTFLAAAILAMRHPRRLVFSGCLAASIAMTICTVLLGWAAPNLLSRRWTHHITKFLYFGFGLWSLWEAYSEEEEDELAEMEEKLDADSKASSQASKGNCEDEDVLKKQRQPILAQFFSPIFLKAFSIVFFGEWGDKSQLATIGLAADENPLGVVLGGIIGQALCVFAAVLGGKSLASKISERIVGLAGGILFIIFGIQSLLSSFQS